MNKTTLKALVIGGATIVVLAFSVWAGLASAGTMRPSPVATAAKGASDLLNTEPPEATATATPPSRPSLSDADFYAYVQTLPGVTGVNADNIDELSGLLCRALRSPKMSPTYFTELVGLEVTGYHVVEAQAIQLLLNASYNACPDVTRTVTARGSISAG
jgi:hypothetical protein